MSFHSIMVAKLVVLRLVHHCKTRTPWHTSAPTTMTSCVHWHLKSRWMKWIYTSIKVQLNQTLAELSEKRQTITADDWKVTMVVNRRQDVCLQVREIQSKKQLYE